MTLDNTEPQDGQVDLERTDRLPVLNLNPTFIDDDVADDAVVLDMATVVPRLRSEYRRAAGMDPLSPAAAKARAVEERLERQKADFEALNVAHERIRAAEHSAKTRVKALTAELSALQALLETERSRAHRSDKSLADQVSMAETMRSRLEEALRELERYQGETRTLRDTLAERDAALTRVLNSLAERNAQLGALQLELSDAKSMPPDVTQTDHKAELHRTREKLVLAEQTQATLRIELSRLQAESRTREEEMSVLLAHLELARRPTDSGDAQTQRMQQELADKSKALDQALEENRQLSVALDSARSALEERELLIRRLERNESSSAPAPGSIQTGIGHVGMIPGAMERAAPEGSALAQCTAEIVRLDGENRGTYVLGRRTRIGRAPGCEIQVQSSSVSRHHALILVGVREVIVEDLNSTNGVLVNGHKAARQLLHDGDQLTIGEAQFKLKLKFDRRPPGSSAPPDTP